MANLSKIKRDNMIAFLEELKKIPEATKTEEEMEELIEYLRSLAI